MNTKTETQMELNLTEPSRLTLVKPDYNVSFFIEDNLIGKLDWNDGVMKFYGEADESAKVFFDNVIKRYSAFTNKPNL
jgi:hypothetical protein